MRIELNQLIAKPHKTIIFAMVAVLSMAGTMEAVAAPSENGCIHSNGRAAGCAEIEEQEVHNIPEPATFALISAGLLGLFGVKRLK